MQKRWLLTLAVVLTTGFAAQGAGTDSPASKPATAPATAPNVAPDTRPAPTFKIGAVAVALPAPSVDFVEVGDDSRPKLELFCPDTNRLISGYVTPADLAKIVQSDPKLEMMRYALVEVPRGAEYMDCKPADFKEVLSGIDDAMGGQIDATFKDAQDAIDRRLKDLNLDTIDIGKPSMLGTLFSMTDAKGFGMVTVVKAGGQSKKIACAFSVLRVKQRLLMVYLYSDYKDESSIKWLGETSERWMTAILAANAQ